MAKAPGTRVTTKRTSTQQKAAAPADKQTMNVPAPEASPEELKAKFEARIARIKVEQDFLIEAGAEVFTVTPAPWVKFAAYRGEHLWTFAVFVKDKVVGVARSENSKINVYPMIAVAALRLFLEGKEKESQLLLGLAGLVESILPNNVSVQPVAMDVSFTDDGKPGYFLLGDAGRVVMGGVDDPEVLTHLNKFAQAYNRYAHNGARGPVGDVSFNLDAALVR
ncbi:hypothetical protein pEaSNUABM29_00050 [Erwinia phage pEa_SNUABM_29]|nr:hypothetical protein pEaSNUABM29_00050 [Erwinia phage pEa_SNUABM_29]